MTWIRLQGASLFTAVLLVVVMAGCDEEAAKKPQKPAAKPAAKGGEAVTKAEKIKLPVTVHALAEEDIEAAEHLLQAGQGLCVGGAWGKSMSRRWRAAFFNCQRDQGQLLQENEAIYLWLRAPEAAMSSPVVPITKVFAITRAERSGRNIELEAEVRYFAGRAEKEARLQAVACIPLRSLSPAARPCLLPTGDYQVTAVIKYLRYDEPGKPEKAEPARLGTAPSAMEHKLAFRVFSVAEVLFGKLSADKARVRFAVGSEQPAGVDGEPGGHAVWANGIYLGDGEEGVALARRLLKELKAAARRMRGKNVDIEVEIVEPKADFNKPLAKALRDAAKGAGF